MRFLFPAVIMLSLFFFNSQQQNTKGKQPQQPAAAEQRGTQNSPLIVKVLPTAKTPDETAQEKHDRDAKAANDGNVVKLTAVLAAVAVLQLFVYGYQAYKLRQTVESAGEQAKAMERHIGEAARSADAMENIVATIEAGNKAVMRAYLTVIVGTPIYQQRRPGQSDLKFEGRPHLVNTGNTQARKVRIRIKGAILPSPLPDDFVFPLPEEVAGTGDATVAAHQMYIMSGIVEDFVPDAEVASIKEGVGRCLYVWGLVTYEDIFGDRHTTRFGQQITWLPNNQAFGYYVPGENDAD
jgi:hypothetical protein